MSSRIYLIIMCGAADRPIAALDGRTPIEAAPTPCLDQLARRGSQAMLTVIENDICPESDSGAMALLSYDPLIHYTGRGPLEGLGTGFIAPGDNAVAFRINFASFNGESGRLDRRTARDVSDDELQPLAQALRDQVTLDGIDDVGFDLMAFGRHRGIICFHSTGRPLGGNVSNTDPGFVRVGAFGVPVGDHAHRPLECEPGDDTDGARNTATVINAFVAESSRVLDAHEVNRRRRAGGKLPANVLLFRDGGDPPGRFPAFADRFHRKLSFYGQIPAEKGLMTLLDGQFTYCRKGEDEVETEYLEALAHTVSQESREVVFVHLKGPDEPGHDGAPGDKTDAIERIDRHFLAPLVAALEDDDTCIVTSDHATPCDLRIHSSDPVPAVVCGPAFEADSATSFGEVHAAAGGLPIKRAVDLLPYVIGRVDGQ